MDGPGDDVLARAGLPCDEHGAHGGRHALHELHDLPHGRRRADDVADAVARLQLRAQTAREVHQVLALEGPRRGHDQLRRAHRLLQIVEGAELDGLHGGLDRGVPGHDEHFRLRRDVPGRAKQLDAVHLGHLDVQQEQVEAVAPEQLQPGARRRGGRHLVPFFDEHAPDALAHHLFVVHGEHPGGLRPASYVVHDRVLVSTLRWDRRARAGAR